MAPIRLGRLHESTAALHGGVAAALTAALMPCRTIPRLAAVPALTTALKCHHAPKDRIHRRRERHGHSCKPREREREERDREKSVPLKANLKV